MYKENNMQFLQYPKVYFLMCEYHIFLNIVDMSEFALKQKCSRTNDPTDINYMITAGKIERQMYEQKLYKVEKLSIFELMDN